MSTTTFSAEALDDVRPRGRMETMFAAVCDALPDPTALVRLDDGTFVWVNQRFTEDFGHSGSEVLGRTARDIGLWGRRVDEASFTRILEDTGRVRDLEAQLLPKDGPPQNALISSKTVTLGRVGYAVIVARRILEHSVLRAEIAHQGLYDPLTDLPSPALLIDRLNNALVRAERRDAFVGIVSLNLDRFRVINHAFGHQGGDALLAEVARRVQGCLRREDTVARSGSEAARVGADEFTIILNEVSSADDALMVVDRIREALEEPFVLNDEKVSVTVSVGVALGDEGKPHAEDLLRRAGIAMRRAKSEGPGRQHVFDSAVDVLEVRRLQLENDLREAVGRGELDLRFQPIVVLQTGTIVGVESLVRWQHPELGDLSPMEFIPIAEESGLIHALGQSVLRQTLEQATVWQKRFPERPPLLLAVNISAEELRDPAFHEAVGALLSELRVSSGQLQIEVSEGLLTQSSVALHHLRRLGTALAIDDFGSGYSSLKFLARLPVDAVKIDQSFIRALGEDPEAASIVEAMTTVARKLHLEVTAKGIETAEQLERVRQLGCTYGQGYYFAEPLRAEAVTALLEENPRW